MDRNIYVAQFHASILGTLSGLIEEFTVGFSSVGIPSLQKYEERLFTLSATQVAMFGMQHLLMHRTPNQKGFKN